jgi:transposase
MLQTNPQQMIFLAVEPIDFRAGIARLQAHCKQIIQQNPFSGSLFVFTNKSRTSVKLLSYDGNGFWLAQKRFSEGKLRWWPKACAVTTIRPAELMIVLAQGIPSKADIPAYWKAPTSPHVSPMPHDNSTVTTVTGCR